MCTVLYVPWPGQRQVALIGLNRDEAYARPSVPPHWWPPEAGEAGFLAPRDLTAGGTWFGVSEHGLLVALTNGRQEGGFRHERSRGALVVTALRRGHLDGALDSLAGLEATAFAPCHLLLAQGGRVAYAAPESQGRFRVALLAPEPLALRNDGLEEVGAALTTRRGHAAGLAALRAALVDHEGATPVCRHGPTWGTCSSAVLLLGASLAESRLFFAAGRPCETAFHEVHHAALSRSETEAVGQTPEGRRATARP